MTIHPYDPSVDDEEGRNGAPDLGDVIRRILGDEDEPTSEPNPAD